ncbi:MAG TPA: hypothetical protein VG371_17190 [Solirubrobacteraceae bacterium]|jgi:hypothetical protein|nr:hypothetical protein [Solirubrobacteraceae bacterium]
MNLQSDHIRKTGSPTRAVAGRPGRPAERYTAAGRPAEPPPAEAIPASPPAEVLDAIGAAADAYDRLKTSGRHLHFETDPVTGKLTIQVLDDEGHLLTTLPPSKVLDLADGAPLD